jgi:lipoprotein NlpI
MNLAPAILPLLTVFFAHVALAAENEKLSPRELIHRGSNEFFAGKIDDSIKSFEQAVTLEPRIKADLWQLGIAYYYADRFADGRDLFELHQTVNLHDVENAVWHFLCVARIDGVGAARKRLIPISGDKRVPMKEVHSLFAGTGSEEQVLKAASSVEGDANRRNALCYAHLYLGLYEEALKNSTKSLEHIRKAAEDFSHDHYMGEVAHVHLKLRTAKN